MVFEKGYLYHIFNQGNNKQKIFYTRDNYIYFLKKINNHILPFVDILSWCLMPNHFHLMVLVDRTEVNSEELVHSTINNQDKKSEENIHLMTYNQPENGQMNIKTRTLNKSIAIMLRSYTRAINKQENRTGSLFKPHTQAACINCFNSIKPTNIHSNILINSHLSKKQYPQVCFDYIHQNPVKAKLVKKAVDWEFSSAKDYAGLRNGKLINKKVTEEYIDISAEIFDEIYL